MVGYAGRTSPGVTLPPESVVRPNWREYPAEANAVKECHGHTTANGEESNGRP